MGDHVGPQDGANPSRGRWQISLTQLLLFPALLGLVLSLIMASYPYSMMTLPFFLLIFVVMHLFGRYLAPTYRPLEMTVAVILLYGLVTILAPGFVDLREPARRMCCQNNLKQIMMALHVYHDCYGSFPPAYIADETGRPMHSWRVLILPFMDRRDLYDRYRFDEPWNGPSNSKLASTRVCEYECPDQNAAGTPMMTSYVAVVGPETVWPGVSTIRFEDVSDGTSNTLMVVEVANSGIHWMEPRDLDAETTASSVNCEGAQGISSLHCAPSWRGERLGANVGLADGSVRFLSTNTPEATIRALLTRAGGETIELD